MKCVYRKIGSRFYQRNRDCTHMVWVGLKPMQAISPSIIPFPALRLRVLLKAHQNQETVCTSWLKDQEKVLLCLQNSGNKINAALTLCSVIMVWLVPSRAPESWPAAAWTTETAATASWACFCALQCDFCSSKTRNKECAFGLHVSELLPGYQKWQPPHLT